MAISIDKLLSYWEKDKSNKQLAQQIVQTYCKAGRFEDCQSFVRSLPQTLLTDPELLWQIGYVYLVSGRIEEASNHFASLQADDLGRAYGLALCHFAGLQYQAARDELQAFVGAEDAQPVPLLLDLRCQYFLGQTDDAFARGLDLLQRWQSPELSGLLAVLALDCNDLEQAGRFAQQALEQEPMQHDANLAMASVLISAQQYGAALEHCKLLTANYPGQGRGWSLLGQIHLVQNRIKDALQAFTTAVKTMPDHIGTWHLKAWCELLLDNLVQAGQSFQSALALNHNFAESHAGVALVEFYKGNLADAGNKLKIAMRLDPNNVTGKFLQSQILRSEGNEQQADSLLASILDSKSHIDSYSYRDLVRSLVSKQH